MTINSPVAAVNSEGSLVNGTSLNMSNIPLLAEGANILKESSPELAISKTRSAIWNILLHSSISSALLTNAID
jgi:hypothetical protein